MQSSRFSSILVSKYRLVIPLALILGIRVFFAGLLYESLIVPGYRLQFMNVYGKAPYSWLYLFSAWDSGYYLYLAIGWYPHTFNPEWAFSPLYPAFVRVLLPFGINPLLAAWLIASVSGAASIVVFQKVAELYFSASRAAISTVLYFLLPPVLLFSGVNYSEPLFLLLSVGTWFFAKKTKFLYANALAALGSLARPNGLLLIIPLTIQCIRSRKLGELVYLLIPILGFGAWVLYGYAMTGKLLVSRTALTTNWETNPLPRGILLSLVGLIEGNLGSVTFLIRNFRIIAEGLLFVAFIVFLGIKAFKIEPALGLYVLISTCVIIPYGFLTSPFSFPRYLTFLFPIGLPLYTRKRWLIVCLVVVFLVLNYLAWNAYLTDSFA